MGKLSKSNFKKLTVSKREGGLLWTLQSRPMEEGENE